MCLSSSLCFFGFIVGIIAELILGIFLFHFRGFLLTPQVTLEPRWYYNLKKRKSKSKRIDGNSGNFISLQTSYLPCGRAISNYSNVEMRAVISFSLLWGIKRNIGNHFDYEVAVGPGFSHTFPDKAGYGTYNDYGLNLLLRIGYRF